MTITSKECTEYYGDPHKEKNMEVWDVPADLEIGVIPKKMYINKDFRPIVEQAFVNLKTRGLASQLKTYDGCFNIRASKGNSSSYSLHAWGLAVDFDAAWNRFNMRPNMSDQIVKCFTDAGCEWGGSWNTPDGMHFQLKVFPSGLAKTESALTVDALKGSIWKTSTGSIHTVLKATEISRGDIYLLMFSHANGSFDIVKITEWLAVYGAQQINIKDL